VLADTFRSTAEYASPPHWKPLLIIGAFSTTVATHPFLPDRSIIIININNNQFKNHQSSKSHFAPKTDKLH